MSVLKLGRVVALYLLCVSAEGADVSIEGKAPERVAFGSCYRPNRNPEIWESIAKLEPELFLFLGDNVYADTSDQEKMRAAYEELNGEKEYAEFKKRIRVIPTWDDHDYGKNDSGSEFEGKKMAKVEFIRAFGIPEEHPMNTRDGIYHSVMIGPPEKRLQIIMLDTRTFRSELKLDGSGYLKNAIPNKDPGATILGEQQWKWLEVQLKEPANLRLIGSSIQFLATQHRFEKWCNFPADFERLRNLLSPELAKQTITLSGDRHMGEMMKDGYYKEITSSGLTNAGGGSKSEKNPLRIGQRVGRRNFGLLEIDWSSGGVPEVTAKLMDANGNEVEAVEWK